MRTPREAPCLTVELASVRLKNPLMNAAGILGLTAYSLKRLADAGLGAVVTKSYGLKPRAGHANPTIVQVEGGLLNSMGLPNPGVEAAASELKEAVAMTDTPIVASIFGFKPEDFEVVAKRLDSLKVAAFEVNVSCPHVKEVGVEIGQKKEALAEVVKQVRRATKKPIIVKLSPNVAQITEMAKAAQDSGAEAVTAINTLKAMAIDIETGAPILAGVFGGLSGPAIKPIAVRCVYELFKEIQIPIIGCGGISNWEDAVEFMMAGASFLQVGTAVMFKDLAVFGEILHGLRDYLKKKGLRSVEELVGRAH
ncbi:dihydroorotate dehydrogenase [Candidatus Hecatella orcuttiae]|uniref:dihydroorotate dehydrogenase n=1 Tax=Candidatus Hecatella orcuttiae TaxID=1935119 RepID=UPI00286827A9|nr:dihydroorotate dehydrogenase [Candidatus Hecatella orcuttiae]